MQRPGKRLTRKAILNTSSHYHKLQKPVSTRGRCPVCHESVYSRAGIHPQCAVKQSESPTPKPQVVVTRLAVGADEVAQQAPAALAGAHQLGTTSTLYPPAPLTPSSAVPPSHA